MTANVISRLMDAAALAETLSMPSSSGMHTSIQITINVRSVELYVRCSGSRNGVSSQVYQATWDEMSRGLINPLTAAMPPIVRSCQEAAYGRHANHSTAPERLP